MARRIAAAILLTVWAILVAGGLAAYGVTRAVLLADLDATLTERAGAMARAAAEGEAVDPAVAHPPAGPHDRYVVRDDVGNIFVSGGGSEERTVAPPQNASFSRLADGRRMRTVTVQVPSQQGDGAGRTITVIYSGPADQVARVLSRLALTLTVCGLAAGAAAAAVASGVSRAALRPLHAASDIVGGIDERKLDRRIDAASLPPELHPVASRLNEMLGRLERAFAQRKQFLADASHELRTPVAALVTTIEVALRRRRDADELTRTLETCLTDARHLKRLVHVLMEHARGEASAASHAEAPEAVDAAELLSECADLAAAIGIPRDVRVERSLPAPMPFITQPQRLRSVVINLLSNAIEYNRAGGLVHITARVEAGALEVIVRDTGRGIAPEHVPHLFEPFYRVDGVRQKSTRPQRTGEAGAMTEETPHLGLGLFLVDSHLKALGGRCNVQSQPGVGTTMSVMVPSSAADPVGNEAAERSEPVLSSSGVSRGVGPVAETTAIQDTTENKRGGSAVWQSARN